MTSRVLASFSSSSCVPLYSWLHCRFVGGGAESTRALVKMAAQSLDLEFTFPCASRGYHEYEPIWSKPTVGEELTARIASGAHEKYINAIALDRQFVCVGHLPRELTRCTAEVIRKGAQVTCKVTSELSRPQSPVGRIVSREIPIEVTVRMDQSQTNELVLQKYKQHVNRYYKDTRVQFTNVTNSHEQLDHNGTSYICT